MLKFLLNKLGRDKTAECFFNDGVTPQYRQITGSEFCAELDRKLLEEAQEVVEAKDKTERTVEFADLLEVIESMAKAHDITMEDVLKAKAEKLHERGGFDKGIYIESISMPEDNPRVLYFRAHSKKYKEI